MRNLILFLYNKVMPKIKIEDVDKRAELRRLLVKELPQCFEREPAPAFTGHFDKLIDKIINL